MPPAPSQRPRSGRGWRCWGPAGSRRRRGCRGSVPTSTPAHLSSATRPTSTRVTASATRARSTVPASAVRSKQVEQSEDLDEVVMTLAGTKVPGVAVGVLHRDRTYVTVHGVTSVTDPLPVDADTLFMIGSITKTLTATALMSLVDEGR